MKIDYPHHLAAHFNKHPKPYAEFDKELLDEIYRNPSTGLWAERYVRFGYDPHEAYCELADGKQGYCPDCEAERIGTPTCTHCDATLTDTRPVDMDGQLLADEARHRSEMEWDWFADIINEYAHSVPTTHLKIEGSNLGWRRASGHRVCKAEDLLDALTINTDATYSCTHDKQTSLLHVTRSHHDAPTGENLTVTPVNLCDVTDEPVALDEINWAGYAQSIAGVTYTTLSREGFREDMKERCHPLVYAMLEALGEEMTNERAGILADIDALINTDNEL